jgi:acyl-CoA synthetase (AMP-forming)/AMP-acid ligase II
MWCTGYVADPEKTAERCTPDGPWYLTGDTGSADADGRFFSTAATTSSGPAHRPPTSVGHESQVTPEMCHSGRMIDLLLTGLKPKVTGHGRSR